MLLFRWIARESAVRQLWSPRSKSLLLTVSAHHGAFPLNAGRQLSKLRSSLRSFFSSHKLSQSVSIGGRPGHYSGGLDENNLSADHIAEVSSAAQAGSSGNGRSESDEIPQKSIGIRQEMDWMEE